MELIYWFFPELPVSGYVWEPENENKSKLFSQLRRCTAEGLGSSQADQLC
jgi:predicted secreted protein